MINAQDIDSPLYAATTLDKGENQFSNVNVRALHVGGWYDHFLQGTIHGYMGYDDQGGPNAQGHQKMIIGPWTHGAVYGSIPFPGIEMGQGELIYPDTSNGIPLMLEWEQQIFNESLWGIENPAIWNGSRVAYYLMGDIDDPTVDANYWKYANDWPLNYNWKKWYLGKDDDGNDALVKSENDLNTSYTYKYEYDPRDPVMTRGGNNQPGFDTAGPMDQRPVEIDENGNLRSDVILFQSEVLDEPYTIEGELKADLYVTTNRKDTDFMVKVCDVYPDGRRMLILDGALSMRFRNGMFQEVPANPNVETKITVDLFSTAYQFNEGHRIAVTITSSNYDRYAINTNTGGNLGEPYTESVVATNRIITGPGKSCIYLPEPV